VGSPLHRLARGHRLRWAVAVVIAVVAGSLAAATVQRAEQARAAYGDARRVPRAASDLAVGTELTDADVVWSDVPVGLVPDDVATAPVGRVVTEPLGKGEVVAERRLSGDGATGAAALVGPGRRALAVPVEATPPGLGVGDHVEAYAPATTGGGLADLARAQSSGARRVARDALVIAVDDRSVTVSVSGAEAPGLAAAVLDGALTLALVTPG
jgi:Flp pilus assembly protein CpaB